MIVIKNSINLIKDLLARKINLILIISLTVLIAHVAYIQYQLIKINQIIDNQNVVLSKFLSGELPQLKLAEDKYTSMPVYTLKLLQDLIKKVNEIAPPATQPAEEGKFNLNQ